MQGDETTNAARRKRLRRNTSKGRRVAALLGITGLLTAGGCGGGGLDGVINGASVHVCSDGAFSPSYAADVDLDRWLSLPVKVYFANTVTFGDTDLETVIRAGFDEWGEATGGVVNYRVVNSAGEANIVVTIEVLPGRPAGGDELGGTDTLVGGDRISSATIRLDVWNGMTREDVFDGLKSTAAHEMGHALGIASHSDDPNDVMYPSHGSDEGILVSTRDANTLKSAYCDEFGRAVGRSRCDDPRTAEPNAPTVVKHFDARPLPARRNAPSEAIGR